jgi:hypothetical protein
MSAYAAYVGNRSHRHNWYAAVRALLTEARRMHARGCTIRPHYGDQRFAPLDEVECARAELYTNLEMLVSCIVAFETLCKEWAGLLEARGVTLPSKPKDKPPLPVYAAADAAPHSIASYFAAALASPSTARPVPHHALGEYWALRHVWLHRSGKPDDRFTAGASSVWKDIQSYITQPDDPVPAPDTDHAWVHFRLLGNAQRDLDGFLEWAASELAIAHPGVRF